MTEKTIKAALLGTGYIASWHAEALRRTKGAELVAVCDVARGAAEQFAAGYGAPAVFTSLEDLLASGMADCIHVLTPPAHHSDALEKIIVAGKAAFVEKPFVLSAAESQRIEALAAERGVVIGVNHNFLMLPSYDRLKQDINDRVIGPIDTFEANWQFPLPPLRSGPFGLWMLREPGNLLLELGPHLFAFVADLFGEMDDIRVNLRNPVDIPGGVTHYQTWRITAVAGNTDVTLNLSLVEGHENRSVRLRGLGALVTYDFAEDVYRREMASMQDIVVGPLARQMSVASQAVSAGFENAFRQTASLNRLSPYGLSFRRAINSFYASLRDGAPVDRRLSPALAGAALTMIGNAIEVARPHFLPKKPPLPASSTPANGKTALVIGGTGFIGRALCHALAERGSQVRVLTRGGGLENERADGRISFVSGSLKSETDLVNAMAGVDCVYHLAKAAETSWEGYLENDVAVTRRIGEACLKAGVERLVYTGTIDSYDASLENRTISEETPFDPDLSRRNLYARSKAACENELKRLERDCGLPLVVVRPGIVIGKGGPLQHWGIAMWRGSAACKLWGDGRNIMPFVLVDDVADGLARVLDDRQALGQSFNLIGEPMLSARDYFDAISDAYGVRMRAQPTPIWTYYITDLAKFWLKRTLARKKGLTEPSFRDWKSRSQKSPFSNEKAKKMLGWRPEADKAAFLRRGVADANLFGVKK